MDLFPLLQVSFQVVVLRGDVSMNSRVLWDSGKNIWQLYVIANVSSVMLFVRGWLERCLGNADGGVSRRQTK